jgi:hypothetical protein
VRGRKGGLIQGDTPLELGAVTSASKVKEMKPKRKHGRTCTAKCKKKAAKMARALDALTLQGNPATLEKCILSGCCGF